ncbi:Protein CBG22403 [Caenorhabditis briggsae]|nr:Protein CBG22403 [Caenorhabditis briggsae]CAP38997.2 Protein CBG22403 [Caenorhabditis briggsae]
MSHLKTEWILMKSVHFLGDYDYKPDDRLARDLTPLTTYSMNKKRRWEILENVGDQKLAGIGKFHRDLDPDEILFLERVNLKTFEWKYLPFVHAPQDFGIQTLHSYKMISKKNYSGHFNCMSQNSIFGQPYSNFRPENRLPEKPKKSGTSEIKADKQSTIIVYNFLRAPRNYMRLGEQYFVASNYGRREPYYAHRRRKLNYEDSQKEINNEIWRFYNNSLDELSEEVNGSEKMENLK